MGAPLSFDMSGTRKLGAEMSGKWQKLRKKTEKDRAGCGHTNSKTILLMISCTVCILPKCQRQLEEGANTGEVMRRRGK